MTTERAEKPKEGWKWLINSTKWHYFRNGTSLCGKWMNLGEDFEQGNDESSSNCKACKTALRKEKLNQLPNQSSCPTSGTPTSVGQRVEPVIEN
jgi:hypothetical protein